MIVKASIFLINCRLSKIPASILSHFIKSNPMNTETLSNVQAVGGLLLTGAGLSMAIDAGTVRAKKGKWFFYGTVALIIFQTGLCLIVGAGRSH